MRERFFHLQVFLNVVLATRFCAGNLHTFVANTNFDNSGKWSGEGHGNEVPCAGDRVEFPHDKVVSIFVQTDYTITEMYLPMNGEFIFDDGVSWGTSDELSSCTGGKHDHAVTYASDPDPWFSTDSWSSTDNDGQTLGSQDLLDIEQVPCDYDTATFPVGNSFTVSISSNVNVQSLTLWNQQMTTGDFASYRDDRGKYQFQDNGVVSVDKIACSDPTGCLCRGKAPDLEDIFRSICDGKCSQKPSCDKPLAPVGQCCDSCGAIVKFNYSDSYTEKAMKEYLANITSDPAYYGTHTALSKISPEMVSAQRNYQQKALQKFYRQDVRVENDFPSIYVQVLITDEETGENSGTVAKALADRIYKDLISDDNGLGVSSVQEQVSGAGKNPPADSNSGLIAGIILGILACVILTGGIVIYVVKRRPSSDANYELPFKNSDSKEKTFENPLFPVVSEVGPGVEHESSTDLPPTKPISEVATVGMPQKSAMDSDFGATFGNPTYEDDYM